MKLWRSAATSVAVALAVGFPTVSASPVTAATAKAAGENGAPVTVAAAAAKQKPARCRSANRTVRITATASKRISGRTYGVEATRNLGLCTTRKNRTTVYSSSLSLKPISGLVKVSVSEGATARSVSRGVTTLTTPLTAKAKFLFKSYRVTGTLRTVVDRFGRVVSQVLDVRRV